MTARKAMVLGASASCVALTAAAIIGCARAGTPAASTRRLVLAPPPPVAPLAFFDLACASCHGPMGLFYGEEFAQQRDDARLALKVREMVEGPGRSTLDTSSLEALVAFHRALQQAPPHPFIVITRASGNELAGEASAGARVRLEVGTSIIEAQTDGFQWTAAMPDDWQRFPNIRIRAIDDDGHETTLNPAHASFSHSTP